MRSSWRFTLIAFGLMVSGALGCIARVSAQVPNVGDVLKKATAKLPEAIVPRAADPITTNLNDAQTGMPLLDGFEPAEITPLPALLLDSGGFLLHPGAFAMNAQSYCLHAGSYAPKRGAGYLYAPLKGSGAPVIRHILQRSIAHPEIQQHDIQILIWAILAHAKIEDLNSESRLVAAKLLSPVELATLNRSALDVVPQSAWQAVAASMPAIARDAFEAENRLRALVTSANSTYAELEAIAVRAGVPRLGPGSRTIPDRRWSYDPGGYFVRYHPTGYAVTHLELYVPERFTIQRDQLGRVASISDRAGNRIETEYDAAIPPLIVPGDAGVRGYAFKAIRLIAVDSSAPQGVRRAELRDSGWTFVGVPSGHGRVGAVPRRGERPLFRYASPVDVSRHRRQRTAQDRYDGWWERYKDAIETMEHIHDYYDALQSGAEVGNEARRQTDPRSEKDIEDLTDLKHYQDGLNTALKITDLQGRAQWIALHLSMVERAVIYAACRLAGGCTTDAPTPFDPSIDVATPVNTSMQRVAQSARLVP